MTTLDVGETIEVRMRYSVECLPTNLTTASGSKFAKARGIDYGLAFLASNNWVLHFDADIAFRPICGGCS